jgi:hypothetical protein
MGALVLYKGHILKCPSYIEGTQYWEQIVLYWRPSKVSVFFLIKTCQSKWLIVDKQIKSWTWEAPHLIKCNKRWTNKNTYP